MTQEQFKHEIVEPAPTVTKPIPVAIIYKRIAGVTLYHVNYNILSRMLDNPNLVLLLAESEEPNVPKYYIRTCEFIDMTTLLQSGLVEAPKSNEWLFIGLEFVPDADVQDIMTKRFNKHLHSLLED